MIWLNVLLIIFISDYKNIIKKVHIFVALLKKTVHNKFAELRLAYSA